MQLFKDVKTASFNYISYPNLTDRSSETSQYLPIITKPPKA